MPNLKNRKDNINQFYGLITSDKFHSINTKKTPTVNCPSQETEVTSTPTRPVDNDSVSNERSTGQKHKYT